MMELKLTDEEMQEVLEIANSCDKSVEGLCHRLEMLTWGDGLLEFRMQGSCPLEWMDRIHNLSERINTRLKSEGILLGPTLEAYDEFLKREPKYKIGSS
jgi:hypothetical protein